MKRSLLIYIGSLALALTTGAQMPNNPAHRRVPQRPSAFPGHEAMSSVRQMGPQRTFSAARFRQPAFSTPRFREPGDFRTTRVQSRMNSSFMNRPAMTNTLARRQTRPAFSNDWARSNFSARPRPTSAFVNRSDASDVAARRDARVAAGNDSRQSRFGEQSRTSSSLLNRFSMNDTGARRQTRTEFNDRRATSYLRGQTRSSLVNRSVATTPAIREQRSEAFSNNWRGAAFSGRQYSTFRNYQSQWHDSGWWSEHCGDRIVFVTVFAQPFPFFFDAGYWYPAWGYYPDAYYPYDGPIYGYNDLPPDEVIANVQTQLYNEGYYSGPIDGILGPDTRAAIAEYQADHGLAVTAAIDEPTVASLGLV
jgi:hypothetical protein